MREKPHDFIGYGLQTVNLYHIALMHVRLELILQQVKGEKFDKVLKFALCCI